MKRLALVVGFLFALAPLLLAQATVFVVRHADRGAEEPDAALTAEGKARAEVLGQLLRDANITHIYTTEFQRTAQTAAPLARLANVQPEVVKQADLDQLTALVRSQWRAAGESALVVGHRASVPKIVKALSGRDIEPLGTSEFDRLLVVTLFPNGKTNVVTLRYGARGGIQ